MIAMSGVFLMAAAAILFPSAWLLAQGAEPLGPVAPGVLGVTGGLGHAGEACASSDYLWTHLARCGRAGPGSTGPRVRQCPDGQLRPLGTSPTGRIVIGQAGRVISCRDITGCLVVEAPGVELRNVRVRCATGRSGEDANGTGVVVVEYGASVRVVNASLNGTSSNHACIWHQGTSLDVKRVNCRGVDDGIFSWSGQESSGNNFTIKRSYFHDFTVTTANGHVDGFQTEGANDGLIAGNTYLMTTDDDDFSTSAIAIWNSMRDSHDIVVRDNLIAGGGFSVYAEDYSPSESSPQGGFSVERISFRDNVFSRHLYGCVGNYGVWFPVGPTDGWRREGNRLLETGGSLDGGNPTYHGQPCT
jgi:hypothetical protein